MLKIAHIINVAEITESNKKSYLHIAQPVTFKSMIVAKHMAKEVVEVELCAVKHQHESVDIPSEFKWAKSIDKYAYEYIESLRDIVPRKPLPRVKDILLSLYESSVADYYIYTNLDIALYPDFYLKVNDFILDGYDALCINRRDLTKTYQDVLLDEDKLELAFMTDGKKHRGIDCFVFKREVVPLLDLGNVYIGFPPIGQVLKTQIELHSRKFLWIKDKQCTFHLGSDRYWRESQGEYASENMKQANSLYVPCFEASCKPSQIVIIKNKLRFWLKRLIQLLE